MKMKKLIKAVALAVCLAMTVPVISPSVGIETVEAATKVKLNCTKKTIYEGDSFKLKVTGTKKKVKWSSSNKKVATVSSKGVVKGIDGGTNKKICKITAVIGDKKYVCTVTVKPVKFDYDNYNNDEPVEENDKPVRSVSENISTLKQFIGSNGYINQDGDRVIEYRSNGSVCAIVYEGRSDALKYIIYNQKSGVTSGITFEITSSNNDSVIEAEYVYSGNNFGLLATGLINPKTYSIYSNLSRVTFTSDIFGVLDNNWQELCNLQLEQGFSGWELALHNNNAPVTMEDIGFTALYNN